VQNIPGFVTESLGLPKRLWQKRKRKERRRRGTMAQYAST